MEQLRKIGLWLLLVKERIVLGIVVLFLLARLYQVFNPTPPPDVEIPPPPSTDLSASEAMPEDPPAQPESIRPTPAEALANNNPFTVQSSPPVAPAGEDGEKAPNLVLRRIREGRDGVEADIQVEGGDRGRYKANDTFGDGKFRVQRIDPAGQTVEVWSTAERKVLTLRAGG